MEVLYDTTKGACHMFARAIAVEYRERGVRCTSVLALRRPPAWCSR